MNNLSQTKDATDQTPANRWSNSVWFRALFLTALVLGVFFRFSGLGNKIYSHDEAFASLRAAGYSGDEASTNLWDGNDKSVQEIGKFLRPDNDKTISDTFTSTALYGPHQAPLFYLLEHYWMRLIGYTPAAMRGLAAVFGLFSIPAMYWLGRELFRTRDAALLATALFALSPFHILYAQDARPYSLWTLATLLSSAALMRAIRVNDKTTWFIYSLTMILGIYSHQLFILVILTHGVYLASLHFLNYRKGFGGFLTACLLALLAYTPWVFYVINRWEIVTSQMNWVTLQSSWRLYIQRWMVIFCSPFLDLDLKSGNLISYLVRTLIGLLMAYALFICVKRGSRAVWMFPVLMFVITAGALIIPDLILGGIRSANGRYFVPANIASLLVVTYFLTHYLDHASLTRYNWSKLLVSVLVLAGIASNLNSLQAETWWNKELGRVRPELVDEIDHDQALLIISGHHATNLGDVLLLSLELDEDVHFKMFRRPADIEYSGNYSNIYWLPSSYREMQEISAQQQLHVREVLPGMLWQIEETSE